MRTRMLKGKVNRKTAFRLALVWLGILLLSFFWLTMHRDSGGITLSAMPVVPKEGDPVIVTFKLNNPESHEELVNYEFFVSGETMASGSALVPGNSTKLYQYIYANPVAYGEQVNFVLRTDTEGVEQTRMMSVPPCPPQALSSFVSFASFSTSVMSSMSTMTYYQGSFSSSGAFNIGIMCSFVLVFMLLFLELTHPAIAGKTLTRLGMLRIRLSTLTWVLLVIFLGMVYTRIMMVLLS